MNIEINELHGAVFFRN